MDRTESGCRRPNVSRAFPRLFGGCCPRWTNSRPDEFAPLATISRMAINNLIGSHSSLRARHVLKLNKGNQYMRRILSILLLLLAGCSASRPTTTNNTSSASDFARLTDDLLYGSLSLSPVGATQAGYHEHNGIQLDELLDDYSPAGIDAQRKFYEDFQSRVNALNSDALDKEQQADLEIMKNDLNLMLLELNTIQGYKHNPTVYVELAGNALFAPYVLEYASKDKRYQHIIKRLEKIPALFQQSRANLADAPEVWNRVAREENEGTIGLIDRTLRGEVPAQQKADYERAAGPAIAALKDFNTYLADELSKKTSDWRLGKEKYDRKCEYVLATGKTPEQLLAEAEADLRTTRAELEEASAP